MPLNREKVLKKLQSVGSELIEEFNFQGREDVFFDLAKYFLGHDSKYDKNKGLIIFGSVGTGKTSIMRVFQKALKYPYKLVNARHIARDCMSADKPSIIIDKYGRHSYKKTQHGHIDHSQPLSVCFDDLGAELSSVKHWGNDLPVMEDIIQDRYIEFIDRGLITHFTTNLNGQMIEDTYGKRTRDRIREMTNAVMIDGESLRK